MIKKNELPEVEPVKLKPIHGIRPGVFILAGLAAALVLLVFALFILPGIVSGTGFIRFSTNTANTAIRTDDGTYIGSSEGSVYRLKAGDYRFVFYVDGVEAGYVDATVPHRIFFTLFRHKTDTIEFNAKYSEEIEEAVTETFTEGVASWSAVTGYDETYHFPPLFSDFATNAVALSFGDISEPFLYGAMHITSSAMYDDYLDALAILQESDVKYSSAELIELDSVLAGIYSGSDTERERSMANPAIEEEKGIDYFFYPECTIEMGESGTITYPESNTAPVKVDVPSFWIAGHTVTEYDYALFVEEVPYWSRSNLENIVNDGNADSNYLDGIALSSSVMSMRPIRNISYKAALAYCDWLSEKIGRNVSLPSEAEWYTASLSAKDEPYNTSLMHLTAEHDAPDSMMGGLWEMTRTPYVPLMRLSDYSRAIELASLYPYDGIIVKGGSYINTPEDISMESVGVIDRSSTSPFVGFRVSIE